MPVLNPSFEDAGALPGEAEHWTLSTVTAAERIAGFGPSPHRASEDFERWSELRAAFGDGDLAMALFDPLAEGFEDFEEAWMSGVYLTELPPGQVVTAPFGGGAVEDMEDGWSNVPYVTAWEDVAAVAGLFDTEPREDFEEGWRSNEHYAWSWGGVTAAAALFDAGAQAVEDFENDWDPASTI